MCVCENIVCVRRSFDKRPRVKREAGRGKLMASAFCFRRTNERPFRSRIFLHFSYSLFQKFFIRWCEETNIALFRKIVGSRSVDHIEDLGREKCLFRYIDFPRTPTQGANSVSSRLTAQGGQTEEKVIKVCAEGAQFPGRNWRIHI